MEETSKVLEQFDVPHEVLVTSAHRSPERTRKYVQGAKRRGIRVMIAGAGGAAHLAGVVAADTHLPVIGVPIASTPLSGPTLSSSWRTTSGSRISVAMVRKLRRPYSTA